MQLNYPKPLKDNATIGLICPAGGFNDYKTINLIKKYLNSFKYKVKLGKSLIPKDKYFSYLSGTDKSRLSDLIDFWLDDDVDAIFCLRGGYGCLRIIPQIDFKKLCTRKKIIVGFSDITILLLAIYNKCNLITFHGPLLGYKFIDKKLNPIDLVTEKNLWNMLSAPKFKFSYSNKSNGVVIHGGKSSGTLLGGNLTDICSMLGTNFLPDFKNSILFLEDCYEEPYRIDRLLTQLSNAGIFDQVNGLIFSSFYKCGFKNKMEIITLLKDKTLKYRVPTIFNFPIGHNTRNCIVPIGIKVLLNANKCTLSSF